MSALEIVERLFQPSAFNLIAPLVPGGVLVLGFMNTTHLARPRINGAPDLLVVVFASYAAGLVLYTVTAMVLSLIAFFLGRVSSSHFQQYPEGLEPWKDRHWRAVARRFLGADLSPEVEGPMPPELLKLDLDLIEARAKTSNLLTLDPELRAANEADRVKQTVEVTQLQQSRKTADFEWHGVYQALAILFPRPQAWGFSESPFVTIVNSTMLALAIILVVSHVYDWKLWVMCASVVLLTMLHDIIAARNYLSDVQGRYYQMAGMLRLLKIPADNASPASFVPPAKN